MHKNETVKDFFDTDDYVLDWLSAPASKMRSGGSHKANFEKRLEVMLRALQKDKEKNILPFKPRKKQA
ncbi:MAG: hypothetical protein Q7T24_08355 [Deltaproteobacteria bacterium]|nr:hypothetical protein [Deltaproteobacteria bacterium]